METHTLQLGLTPEEIVKELRDCDIGDIVLLPGKGRFLVAPAKYDPKHAPCETCVFQKEHNESEYTCPFMGACAAHKRKDRKPVNFPRQFKA